MEADPEAEADREVCWRMDEGDVLDEGDDGSDEDGCLGIVVMIGLFAASVVAWLIIIFRLVRWLSAAFGMGC